ncbi:MAG: hypothetical protein ACK4PK_04675 [Alphaproteobacteria bacterium]|jgi:hypothetical protein
MQAETERRIVTGVGTFMVVGMALGVAHNTIEFFQERAAKKAFNDAGYKTTGKKITYTAQKDGETFEGVYEKGALNIRKVAPATP